MTAAVTSISAMEAMLSGQPAASSASINASPEASNQSSGGPRRVPVSIPADQAYYWSSEWQRGEVESLINLRAGNAKTFEAPLDAVRYLLGDD